MVMRKKKKKYFNFKIFFTMFIANNNKETTQKTFASYDYCQHIVYEYDYVYV